MKTSDIAAGLDEFAREEIGAAARVENLVESDGHAGLTFLFDVIDESGARAGYVIKLAPPGVRRHGNTDVFRQAPLLRALHAAGLPVPAVPYACAEESTWFGVPFIVMERLPGTTFFMWTPSDVHDLSPAACKRRYVQAAEALAGVHLFDWQNALTAWESPASLHAEITRWEPVYAKAPEAAWASAAERAEAKLLDALPDGQPVGLFHGDYQPGNCLYEGDALTGIIDWELSGIGAQLLDIGWLNMICDKRIWVPEWRALHAPEPTVLNDAYCDITGADKHLIDWYTALAAYRLGAITCLNVRLHRTGRRHDPLWENNALCVMPMFARVTELV